MLAAAAAGVPLPPPRFASEMDLLVDGEDAVEGLVSGLEEELDDDGGHVLMDAKRAQVDTIAAQARFVTPAALRAGLGAWTALAGRLQCNTFSVTEDAKPAKATMAAAATTDPHAQGETVGVGLYPSAALLNHSCEPNCAVRFDLADGALLEARTTKPVAAGDELTIAYIDLRLRREARRAKLLREYAFECTCARCEAEAPRAAPPRSRGVGGASATKPEVLGPLTKRARRR